MQKPTSIALLPENERKLHRWGTIMPTPAKATTDDAEVLVDGVSLLIHGLRVSRLPDGRMGVEAPTTRNEAGRWVPAVTLPPELGRAMAEVVLGAMGCEKMVV